MEAGAFIRVLLHWMNVVIESHGDGIGEVALQIVDLAHRSHLLDMTELVSKKRAVRRHISGRGDLARTKRHRVLGAAIED